MSYTFDFTQNADADPIEAWVSRLINRKNITTTEAALGLLLAHRIGCCCSNPLMMENGELARLARSVGLDISRHEPWQRLKNALLKLHREGFIVLLVRNDGDVRGHTLSAIQIVLSGGR